MLIYFGNDTSSYHGGSWAVCEVIRALAREKGHVLMAEENPRVLEKERIACCDGILINGEGTIHHDKPRARHLLAILEFGQSLGKQTILCNTSWSEMSHDFDDVLKRLDNFTVREGRSADELRRKHGIDPDVCLDLSLYHPARGEAGERNIGLLATDFYSSEFNSFVKPTGGALADLPWLDMRNSDWQATLNQVARCRVLLSGRYHGIYAAARTRTPFVPFPGNTHKVEGVIELSGFPIPIARHPGELIRLGKEAQRYKSMFNEFFDWMEGQRRWDLPI